MCDLLIPGLIIAGAALALGNAGNSNSCEPVCAPQPVAYAAPAPCAPQAPAYGAPTHYTSSNTYYGSAPVRPVSNRHYSAASSSRYTAGSVYQSGSASASVGYGSVSGSYHQH